MLLQSLTVKDEAARLFAIAFEHEKKQQYNEANILYTRSMELGNPKARDSLAFLLYCMGTKNEAHGHLSAAKECLCRSINLGCLASKKRLSCILHDSEAPHDNAQAYRYWRELAEIGDVGCMVNTGTIYSLGLCGSPQCYKTAISWYLRAILAPWKQFEFYDDNDEAEARSMACYNMGKSLFEGWGVPKDLDRASVYFRRAIAYGDDTSAYKDAKYYLCEN
jgi:TPR repeat protein